MDDSVVGAAGAGVAGTLYIVSTPIGNLGDLSARALETLRSADAILAEDTRHTRALLSHFDLHTPLESYHEHNEAASTPGLVGRLQLGATLALVSDAGTPLLSDPGARLVRAAAAAGIAVVPIPGASALLAALVGAALSADRFTFFGFVPRKGPERRSLLADVAALRHTAVLYEAPGRVAETLDDLAAAGAGGREAVVARELTKQFEEFRRGTEGARGRLAGRRAERSGRGARSDGGRGSTPQPGLSPRPRLTHAPPTHPPARAPVAGRRGPHGDVAARGAAARATPRGRAPAVRRRW